MLEVISITGTKMLPDSHLQTLIVFRSKSIVVFGTHF